MNRDFKEQVKTILSRWTDGLCPGGQVLIRKNHETVYEGAFGYANLENRLPITEIGRAHV